MIIPLLDETGLAEQIASLVNNNNKLLAKISKWTIMKVRSTYLVEMVGNEVVGCVGVDPYSSTWDEICHVCVKPEMRGKGLGSRLFKTALRHTKKNAFCTIREDNLPSLRAALSAGFEIKGKKWSQGGYWLVILTKKKDEKKCSYQPNGIF